MRKIKIGQIGVRHDHAGHTMRSLRKFSDVFEVVGVVSDDDNRLKESCYDGVPRMTVEEMLSVDGLDAVAVESYELTSVDFAQRCIDAGIHVHLDKPGGESDEKFTHLAKTAKEKNLCLHLGYMYRYNPEVKKLKKDIAEGKLGEIYSVEAQMNCEHGKPKRDWLGAFRGGMMFFLGCHLIDLIVSIQGIPENIVCYNHATGFDDIKALDCGFCVLEYKNGVSFAKSCASEVDGFVRRQLVVCGKSGTVELKPLEDFIAGSAGGSNIYTGVAEVYSSDTKGAWHDCRTLRKSVAFDRYDDMMLDFAAIVRGEKQNDYSYEYEVAVQRCVLAASGIDVDYKSKVVL